LKLPPLEKLGKKPEALYDQNFKTFLTELKNKKSNPSIKRQDEREEYFESYQKELLDIQT
jgi:hypothetical protein